MQAEDQEVQQQQVDGGEGEGDPAQDFTFRGEADEDQDRGAEDDSVAASHDQIVGGGSGIIRIDLTRFFSFRLKRNR